MNTLILEGAIFGTWLDSNAKVFVDPYVICPDGRVSRMSIAPEKLVRQFYHDVWNRADEALARTILTPDFRFRGSLGLEKSGPDGFIDYMRAIHAALGGYNCTIEDLISTEMRVAARMTFSGRHQGELFGVAPTDRHITWSGAAFFSVSAGKISELWVLGDIDAIKSQLAKP